MADEGLVSIRDRLLKERHALLDLSTRNRLLNTPLRTRNNRAIEIVDEKAPEVFRLLSEGRSLSFVPGVELSEEERVGLDPEDDITGGIPQPEEDTADHGGVAARHADLRLQTRLTSEGLQKRLFDIWYDAQTIEEEQGVNILYLALGLLRWFDADNSDIARHAPLVLLPVRLERSSAADRFKLKWRDEPPSPNLTLQAKMKAEFGLIIEDFRDEDEVDLADYCARVAETVASKARWEVLPDSMVLGFFSFSKFLMYRDLDPENWPADAPIDQREAIKALLRDGFPENAPLISDEVPLDSTIPPIELHHVVDADSSQTVVIAEAAGGRSLVVKGPPGTGKSQTITNIIAAAAARGRKVLFVAEKMAALDVVHLRLQQVGLGPLTLELHSNKVSKRTVLEELKRTRDASLRRPRNDLTIVQKLGDTRSALNAFAERLHRSLEPSGLSPFLILGRLARAQKSGGKVYPLTDANAWTQEDVALRRALALEVADRVRGVEPLPAHVWRGARCAALDPVERTELLRNVTETAGQLSEAVQLATKAAEVLGLPAIQSVKDLDRALDALSVLPVPAGADLAAMALPAWSENREEVADLVAAGQSHTAASERAERSFNRAGLESDLTAIRSAVVIKGKSLFRLFDSNYRAQLALLRSYLSVPLPKTQEERIALVDEALDAQAAKKEFESRANAGEAFGKAWKGERSEWDRLAAVIDWRTANADLPAVAWRQLEAASDAGSLSATKSALAAALPSVRRRLEQLFDFLSLDLRRAFGVETSDDLPVNDLAERLEDWQTNSEALSRYVAFEARARELAEKGCSSLVEALHAGELDQASLVQAFDNAYAEVLRLALFTDWPELRSFDGDAHNTQVEYFRTLDKARIHLAQEQIVAEHAEGRPHGASGIGPLGVLNAEIARKRGHLPIRKLLEKAGPAIQQLKPVFMMSPLSVAQFLKPGGLKFDLLVMDEASQIEPVDALGAIARTDQLVVVGDEKQLPPTAFFKKLTGDGDDDSAEDDGIVIQAKDAESILDLCLAKGVPARMLSWHYRSKHQSLIAVSNREFYENRLFIVPSPYDAIAGMGLKFNLLRNAPYERGASRTNPSEAKAVAEAVIHHARTHPEQSLGVATFSVAQRQAVLKELELLRRANADTEEFFLGGGAEPFFVKNLENIQGDERDVIFISVGYGKTEEGYLAHAFGPLSGEGGERRLNVLISRAKLRCEVFANFTGADLDLERTRARGVAALKLFLTFAETGHFGLGEVSGEDFESEFEIDVCERLQALGYDVKRQIGASGFRVDLAIADPERPGRFVLGIECDGAQFHSSRSARDRDRLRQEVLEAHGWIIHRVWSADWYLRPEAELKKIEQAYAAAKDEWAARDEDGYSPERAVPLTIEVAELDEHTDLFTGVIGPASASISRPQPYVEANFPVSREVDPHEAPLGRLADYVEQIVEVEGPIHIDEITARIRILWGLGRAGNRIRAAVQKAVQSATRRGTVVGDSFYMRPDQVVTTRDRSNVSSSSLRRPDMLPPNEIEHAMLEIVRANYGASREDLIQAASRAFGFAATSGQLRGVLAESVDRLLIRGKLVAQGELLVAS